MPVVALAKSAREFGVCREAGLPWAVRVGTLTLALLRARQWLT